MHTPAGYTLEGETFMVADWWAAIFSPSFPYRLAHMGTAAYLTTAFVVISVGALYLLQGRFREHAKRMLSMTFWLVTILAPLQIVLGDLHGLNTLEHQPAKIAAMEGHWETQRGAPLLLFAWPDMEDEENHFELAIPKLGSLILTHTLDGEIQPLTAVPASERPPVKPVFYAFRVMVGLGLAMLLLTLLSLWAWRRGRLFDSPWLLRSWNAMLPAGFISILAGWYVVEIGRQPYVVYGLLRTADAVTPTINAGSVLASLLVFAGVYVTVFGAGIWYLLKLVRKGPQPQEPAPQRERGDKTPARPLSVGEEA
jgi:cytochrome d ubiquinol oxidase subunit I